MSRSLAVNAPSLNIGWPNRFVVAVVTLVPVSSSALRNAAISSSRSVFDASNGNTSLSWKFTPYAPSAASLRTARAAGIGGRTGPPNTSTPCQPTVQMPNENLSAGTGTYESSAVVTLCPFVPRQGVIPQRGVSIADIGARFGGECLRRRAGPGGWPGRAGPRRLTERPGGLPGRPQSHVLSGFGDGHRHAE